MPQTITFNAETGGFGDLCAVIWLAEGLKMQGDMPLFHAIHHMKRDIIERCGHSWVDRPSGSVPLGMHFPPYGIELRETRANKPRLVQWGHNLVVPCVPVRPTLKITPEEMGQADKQWSQDLGDKPRVALFPFSDYQARNWPLAYWLDLGFQLKAKGFAVAFFVTHQRAPEINKHPLWCYWGQDWAFLIRMMATAHVVVSNDSGPAWMSGTIGKVPTLALMGPTSNIFTLCPNVEEVGVTKEITPCRGCHFAGDQGFRVACDAQCRALMRLEPEHVCERVVRLLETQP